MSERYAKIADFLRGHDRFALICHLHPDGDAFGAVFLLKLALESMGKTACVCCESGVPAHLRVLDGIASVECTCSYAGEYAAVCVDCGDLERTGACLPVFQGAMFTANIDHHRTNTQFAQINHVESDAAASCEIVWRLIRSLGVRPDARMGLCAYVGLSTDTGNFSFSNVTPATFLAASEALSTGFCLPDAADVLFRERRMGNARVLAHCVEQARFCCENRIAVTWITRKELDTLGACDEDVEGVSEFLRDIDTVEAAATLRELDDNCFKVSLRSSHIVDVSEISRKYGGGGHQRAAGCTLHDSCENAVALMEAELIRALEEH